MKFSNDLHKSRAIDEFITAVYKEGKLEVKWQHFWICQLTQIFQVDSIITCYLYVERIVMCGLPLTRRNVRPVVFTAMLLASKVRKELGFGLC